MEEREMVGKQSHLSALLDLWRVFIAVAVGQLVGGIAGSLALAEGSVFQRRYTGAASMTPVAFVAGCLWYLAARRSKPKAVVALLILAVLAAVVSVGGLCQLSLVEHEADRLSTLRSLREDAISRVVAYDESRDRQLVSITDDRALSGFMYALRQAKPYSPSHPKYVKSWYLVAEGEAGFDLYCHYEEGKEDTVACYLLRSGRIEARFTSDGLREWFERHVEGRGE